MSDPNLTMQRQIQALNDVQEQLRKADVTAIYLPWSQRVLSPFPLASSGGGFADTAQPWAAYLLTFACTVNVLTTNNGTNFWTLALINSAGTTLATLSTSAIAAATWTRLSTATITQPATTNAVLTILATATLSPGAICIVPSLARLRTGN